jgi:hypothetical protein
MKKTKSSMIGDYVVCLIFFLMALFFLSMLLFGQDQDQGRLGKLAIGFVIFVGFLIVFLRTVLKHNSTKK